MEYVWHKGAIPNGQISQVYGFVVTSDDLVALVRDKGEQRFTPVGGGVEAGEGPSEAFRRELREEAQLEADELELLGTVEIRGESVHELQARYACRAKEIKSFTPNKDGFEVEERIFVHIDDLPRYVHWLNTPEGMEVLEALKEHLHI